MLYPKNERQADNPNHAKMRQACIKLCSGEAGPLLKRGRKLGIPASLSDIVRLEKGDTRNTTTIEQISNAIDIKR